MLWASEIDAEIMKASAEPHNPHGNPEPETLRKNATRKTLDMMLALAGYSTSARFLGSPCIEDPTTPPLYLGSVISETPVSTVAARDSRFLV